MFVEIGEDERTPNLLQKTEHRDGGGRLVAS